MLLAILAVSSVSVINWWWFISTRKFLKQSLMADEIGNEKNTSWLNLKLSLAPSPLLYCLCNCNIDIYLFIKCSEKCTCHYWWELVHYISIKHAPYRSALLRYNACSQRHLYERAQLAIHFIREIKNPVPWALLSFIK